MNRNEAQALREQRSKAHAFAVSLLANGNLNAEQRSQFDRAMADVEALGTQIAKIEAPGVYVPAKSYDPRENRHAEAFGNFIRRGKDRLSAEERTLLETRDGIVEGSQTAHIGTFTGMGFFVPTGFRDQVEQATKWYANLMSVCGVIETASGNALPMPTSNDTNQKAVPVGESTETDEKDTTSSHVVFGANKYTAGLVKVSIELLQDSAFDLEAWLASRFGERYGRGYEADFTNGAGQSVGQPVGIIPAILASGAVPVIAQGKSDTTGVAGDTGANSVGYSDLVNLEHSVDPSYRRNARYMFHDQTLSALKRILDKFGRPLWVPGIAVGEPSTILGYQYVINQAMPQIAVSANTVVFGAFDKYIIRKVKAMTVQRLDERFATAGQVAFLSFSRIDGNLLDAGTHPLNILQQHS